MRRKFPFSSTSNSFRKFQVVEVVTDSFIVFVDSEDLSMIGQLMRKK